MNQAGIDLVKSFEGFRSKPYLCPAGIATIGYGTTVYPTGKKVTLNDTAITEECAVEYLKHDITDYESKVEKLILKKINENQLSALVSFAYNVGIWNLKRSTLLKRVNADPDQANIREQFLKWVYAYSPNLKKQVILPGLIRRRTAEANLYFTKP